MPDSAGGPILHVIPSLGRGGAERQLVRLIRAVDRNRWPQIVCQLGGPRDFAEDVRGAGATLVDLNLPGRRPWIRSAYGVGRVIRRFRPVIVVSWLFDASIATYLASPTRRGTAWISTLHNTDYDPSAVPISARSRAKVRCLLMLDRTQVRSSRVRFVAVSDTVLFSAIQHLGIPSDRIMTFPNCVDPHDLETGGGEAQAWRSSLGIPPPAVVVLSVGRLHPQKGFLSLIEAFAETTRTRPEAHLVIVGRGPQRDHLATRAKELGLEGRVHLPGTMGRIGVAMSAADVFAFLSRYEGFGIALVEAMWTGLPVVATRIPVLQELVEDERTGLLVSPGSLEGLVDALGRLLDDAVLRETLGRAGAISARRFTPDAIVPGWHDLWASLASSR